VLQAPLEFATTSGVRFRRDFSGPPEYRGSLAGMAFAGGDEVVWRRAVGVRRSTVADL